MTYWGPEQVEAVKAAADLVRVAERYCQGMRASGSHFTARCCFHDERTPSLYLYPEQGRYHCFGCGAHGDVVALVQQRESLTFQEAVERLAREFGVPIADRAAAGKREDHSDLYRACELAAATYEAALWSPAGADALAYLRSRKLSDDTIRRHRMGWAGGGGVVRDAARAAGLADRAVLDADLVVDRAGGLLDRFYLRVTVPVHDERGRVVGFTARMLPDDLAKAEAAGRSPGKYINTAETPIFRKGASVFHLHRAAGAARAGRANRKRLILLEGALDVIAADQAGYPEAVAALGTALTPDQAGQLRRAAGAGGQVVVALDGDDAGRAATGKALRTLLGVGAAVRVAALPDRTDPAELLVEDATDDSRRAWDDCLASAVPGLDRLLVELAPDGAALDQPARLRALDEVIRVVRGVPDPDLRQLYLDDAAGELGVPRTAARERLTRALADTHSSPPATPPPGGTGGAPPPPPWTPRYELNETGNAHRFRDAHRDDVRFVHTWGVWLVWRGTHWAIDTDRDVERRMTSAIAATCDEDIAALDAAISRAVSEIVIQRLVDNREEVRRWRTKNLNDRAIVNSLNRAASLADLAIVALALDRDPWLFTVANGTLDLRTGELRAHDRADLITRLCPVDYDPAAVNDRWLAFVAALTNADAELTAYLQRFCGYAMTGVTKEDACLMLAGTGGSGKSTFTSACSEILGSYARPLPFELFLTSHGDKRKWSLAEASQCRLVVCEESEEGKRFNASLVKQVTGGTEIEAERKHGQPFVYKPRFKVWFITNDPPYVSDHDRGFWRRLHLVRCDHIPANPDRDLKDYLRADPAAQRAVLAWMVAGAGAYAKAGLQPPAAVLHATEHYRGEQDPLRDYRAECLVLDAEACPVAICDLYRHYLAWCAEQAIKHPISQKSFGMRLAKLEVETDAWIYSPERQRTVRAYRGVRYRRGNELPQAEDSPHVSPHVSPPIGGDSAGTPPPAIATHPSPPGGPSTSVAGPEQTGGDAMRGETCGETCGETNPMPAPDLPDSATHAPPDAHARGARAPTREGSISSEPSIGKGRNQEPTRGDDQPTRAQRLSAEPSPAEDVFSDPPLREPGADEDEPPWPPPPPSPDETLPPDWTNP